MLLAIDTSTRHASAALYEESEVVAESTWLARENHTTSLLPQLLHLFELSGSRLESIRAVAVATGPGSFTGLRIGLSLAKGLALARGIPVVGIPTLDGMAQAFAQQALSIWAVLQVGRGRFAAASYLPQGREVLRIGEYMFGDAAFVAASMAAEEERRSEGEGSPLPAGRVLICGELDVSLKNQVRERLQARAEVANTASSLRRAAYLAEIGWQDWQMNRMSDLASLAPYYVPTASLPQAGAR